MKKILLVCLCISLLAGCSAEKSNVDNKQVEKNVINNAIIEDEIEIVNDNNRNNYSEMSLTEIELKLSELELSLIDYEDDLSLLIIAKDSYEENIELSKRLHPDTYEDDRTYRENKANLTQVLYKIQQLEIPMNNIKSQMEELKNIDIYKQKLYEERRQEQLRKEEEERQKQLEKERENQLVENYNNTTVTGTMVKAAYQNFYRKPMAILVHTQEMNLEMYDLFGNFDKINGLRFENYNAILNLDVYPDLVDNIISNSNANIFKENYGFVANMKSPGEDDMNGKGYFDNETLFSASLIKTENGEVCGLMFIEKY